MVLGALSNFIPKIEGFAPLPNASADTFMSMQGGHMALLFGGYYTLGKRLVAALPNETFNDLATNPEKFTDLLNPHFNAITKMFKDHLLSDVDEIQKLVLEKAYDMEILKIHQNVELIKSLPAAYWDAIFQVQKNIDNNVTPTTNQPGENRREPKISTPVITTPTVPETLPENPDEQIRTMWSGTVYNFKLETSLGATFKRLMTIPQAQATLQTFKRSAINLAKMSPNFRKYTTRNIQLLTNQLTVFKRADKNRRR